MKKVALVIGHTEFSEQGAYSPHLKKYENGFWREWVEKHKDWLEERFDIIYHQDISSYKQRIKALEDKYPKHSWELGVELHFNSFNNPTANGSEVLVRGGLGEGDVTLQDWLKINHAPEDMGIKNRGIKRARKNDKGGLFLHSPVFKSTMILEPFFGSNKKDCQSFIDNQEGFLLFLDLLSEKYNGRSELLILKEKLKNTEYLLKDRENTIKQLELDMSVVLDQHSKEVQRLSDYISDLEGSIMVDNSRLLEECKALEVKLKESERGEKKYKAWWKESHTKNKEYREKLKLKIESVNSCVLKIKKKKLKNKILNLLTDIYKYTDII